MSTSRTRASRSAAEVQVAANDAAVARITAVMASEHYAGREGLALNLLGAGMAVDEIVGALAVTPLASAAPDPDRMESVMCAEMRAMIAETPNSKVDAIGGGGGKPSGEQSANAAWDKTYDNLFGPKSGN